MSTTNTNPNNPVENKGATSGVKPIVTPVQVISPPISAKSVVRIQPSSKGTKSNNSENEREAILRHAKIIEPAVDTFAGIIDSTVAKLVTITADSILDDTEQAEALGEKVKMSKASRDALRISGSRIISKRWPESDFMDVANVGAAFGEMGIGLLAVAKELMAIRKLKISESQIKNKNP